MEVVERRYDIDWLRVIAIGLLLIYHIGIAFQPWGVLIGFIQNGEALEGLWVPMSMLNIWRIPLLFFVSGMGLSFSMRRRTVLQLLGERSRRILLPFLFGIVAIVPLHILLWQKYYNQDISYSIQQSHLWFLLNIFSYALIITPLIILSGKKQWSKIVNALKRLYSSPLAILLVMIIFVAETLLVKPATYESFAVSWHGYFVGLLAFLFGFTFVASANTFRYAVQQWRWIYLSAAVILFLIRYLIFELQSPLLLKPVEMVLWVFSAFGFAGKYLDRSSPVLSYLSKAAYPVYILHMIFLYLASYYIMPTGLAGSIKFILVCIITFTACFVSYELIRRIKPIRPLFGLNVN